MDNVFVRFEIKPCGDPYNTHGWDVTEVEKTPEGKLQYWFRGDISPIHGRDNTMYKLERERPGCKVRVER